LTHCGVGLLNRELSWLDFNARPPTAPRDPHDRARTGEVPRDLQQEPRRVLQVGCRAWFEALVAGHPHPHPRRHGAGEQLDAIRVRVADLVDRQAAVFTKEVAPRSTWRAVDTDLGVARRRRPGRWRSTFEEKIFPVLTPLSVDPAHPFPYISSLSLNLAVMLHDPVSGSRGFARVKVPPLLPRFLELAGGAGLLPLEELIAGNLDRMFPGMEVVGQHPFRVSRDADSSLADESEDVLEAMETVLRERTRAGMPVRLEVDPRMGDELLELLCREIDLGPRDVTVVDGMLDLSSLWSLYSFDRPDLKDPPSPPRPPGARPRRGPGRRLRRARRR